MQGIILVVWKERLHRARAGFKDSLDNVKKGFMRGLVMKDEYANTYVLQQ